MAFCRGKNQKLLFKVDSKLKFCKFYPTRPEGAEAHISSTPCFTLIEQALSAFFNVNYV